VQVQNEERSELGVRVANLEVSEHRLDPEEEPELSRAMDRLKLAQSDDVPRDRSGVEGSLVNWAQGLLDVTFNIENRMVDEGFAKEELFGAVMAALAEIEELCVELDGVWGRAPRREVRREEQEQEQEERGGGGQGGGHDGDVAAVGRLALPRSTETMKSWLGEGMAECVHWRRGALMYMRVATMAADKGPIPRRMLSEGLEHLELFLNARGGRMAEGMSQGEAEGDVGVREMIKARILGDTHLLAVVYAGEMCYWGCTGARPRGDAEVPAPTLLLLQMSPPEEGSAVLDDSVLRRAGRAKLALYLRVVSIMTSDGGGGVGAGWDTARAQSLLFLLEG
jgi:hypothetical protein